MHVIGYFHGYSACDWLFTVLQHLRGKEDVQSEMEEMVREKAAQENEKTVSFQLQKQLNPSITIPALLVKR